MCVYTALLLQHFLTLYYTEYELNNIFVGPPHGTNFLNQIHYNWPGLQYLWNGLLYVFST